MHDNSLGYSGSIPTGVTPPTYPNGRLVEAATDSCSSGTLITDEWLRSVDLVATKAAAALDSADRSHTTQTVILRLPLLGVLSSGSGAEYR